MIAVHKRNDRWFNGRKGINEFLMINKQSANKCARRERAREKEIQLCESKKMNAIRISFETFHLATAAVAAAIAAVNSQIIHRDITADRSRSLFTRIIHSDHFIFFILKPARFLQWKFFFILFFFLQSQAHTPERDKDKSIDVVKRFYIYGPN